MNGRSDFPGIRRVADILGRALNQHRPPLERLTELIEGIVTAGLEAAQQCDSAELRVVVERLRALFVQDIEAMSLLGELPETRQAIILAWKKRAKKAKVSDLPADFIEQLMDQAAKVGNDTVQLRQLVAAEGEDAPMDRWSWLSIVLLVSQEDDVVALRQAIILSTILLTFERVGDAILSAESEELLVRKVLALVGSPHFDWETTTDRAEILDFAGRVGEELLVSVFNGQEVAQSIGAMVRLSDRLTGSHKAEMEPFNLLLGELQSERLV